MTEQIMVAFEGEGSGVDDLSWGQLDLWMAMRRQNSWLPMGGATPLPDGTSLADVVENLRYLMSRYQPMRTRLRFDADDRPSQVVSSSGEIALDVVEAGDDDPAELADAMRRRYEETDYDYVTQWPMRMGVVVRSGQPTHLVAIMCHLVTDGSGAAVMIAESGARVATPVKGMQPLEQARWQRSPAGVRQNEAALRYWERLLRTIPSRRFAGSDDPRQPRHWRGEFRSQALHLATQAIAARAGLDASPVLMAVYGVALHRMTGINPVVFRPTVNNRFRPALADVVCTVAESGLCALDVAGVPFSEALTRTQRAAMTAYKHAYFHPVHLQDLIASVAAERDPDFDLGCFYNDRRITTRAGATGPAPTPDQIREALCGGNTTFRWTIQQDDPFERLFVHIDDVPDTIQITVFMDTHFVSPGDAEAFLRGMEEVAVEAALDLVPQGQAR
ncbi:condensation domain-containing protein [Dactylosporangium sp. NPDC050588]|uniref:condensation domain-containing protein n=1 Tax=Dactylosporangium sp. NPDC050588 TaxID=3157211 RepID=UPI0033D75A7F